MVWWEQAWEYLFSLTISLPAWAQAEKGPEEKKGTTHYQTCDSFPPTTLSLSLTLIHPLFLPFLTLTSPCIYLSSACSAFLSAQSVPHVSVFCLGFLQPLVFHVCTWLSLRVSKWEVELVLLQVAIPVLDLGPAVWDSFSGPQTLKDNMRKTNADSFLPGIESVLKKCEFYSYLPSETLLFWYFGSWTRFRLGKV